MPSFPAPRCRPFLSLLFSVALQKKPVCSMGASLVRSASVLSGLRRAVVGGSERRSETNCGPLSPRCGGGVGAILVYPSLAKALPCHRYLFFFFFPCARALARRRRLSDAKGIFSVDAAPNFMESLRPLPPLLTFLYRASFGRDPGSCGILGDE